MNQNYDDIDRYLKRPISQISSKAFAAKVISLVLSLGIPIRARSVGMTAGTFYFGVGGTYDILLDDLHKLSPFVGPARLSINTDDDLDYSAHYIEVSFPINDNTP